MVTRLLCNDPDRLKWPVLLAFRPLLRQTQAQRKHVAQKKKACIADDTNDII